jgi:hypothetical protein
MSGAVAWLLAHRVVVGLAAILVIVAVVVLFDIFGSDQP